MRATVRERLDRYTLDESTGCHIWTGARNNMGYGTIQIDGSPQLTHRVAYELSVGPIPDGLVLDHLCSNRACMNADHLEPVTQRENTLRSASTLGSINAAKTHCPQGHPYDEANTYVFQSKSPRQSINRVCRACRAAYARRYYLARKQAI